MCVSIVGIIGVMSGFYLDDIGILLELYHVC
jgi:hypothetical protein